MRWEQVNIRICEIRGEPIVEVWQDKEVKVSNGAEGERQTARAIYDSEPSVLVRDWCRDPAMARILLEEMTPQHAWDVPDELLDCEKIARAYLEWASKHRTA